MMPMLVIPKPTPLERRTLGDYWEHRFCDLAAAYGKEYTAHQIGRTHGAACSYWRDPISRAMHKGLLPDVSCWGAPSEHYEVKHKNPTIRRSYGLEAYRLSELVRFAARVQQPVYYVIHDWQHAGASKSTDPMPNRIEDWFYADVYELNYGHAHEAGLPSLVHGQMKADVLQYFWPTEDFRPLLNLWTSANANGMCCGVMSDLPFCIGCGRYVYEEAR